MDNVGFEGSRNVFGDADNSDDGHGQRPNSRHSRLLLSAYP
jgi:hypothetical protein